MQKNKARWAWQDLTVLLLRLLWSTAVIILMYQDKPDFPLLLVLPAVLLGGVVPSWVGRNFTTRYVLLEFILAGGIALALAYYFGLTRLFLPAVLMLAFHTRGKAHFYTLPLTLLLFSLSAGPAIQAGLSHPLIWQSLSDGLFVYAAGYGLQVGAKSINGIRQKLALVNEQYAILEQYSSQIERMTLLEERYRMAREVHDTIGHSYTSIILGLETLRPYVAAQEGEHKLQGVLELARKGLDDVRLQVHQMDPLEEPVTLDRALMQIAGQFESNTGVALSFRTMGEPYAVIKQAKHTLSRSLQEALTNASRHGQASAIRVVLQYDPAQLMLQIQDNGKGTAQLRYGFGLTGMKERLAALQGKLYIDSQENDGTLVTCIIPNQTQEGERRIDILLADDQPLVRESLRLLLGEEKDFRLRTAASGKQALEQCAAEQPDIVLMDIHMPEMDGLEATRQLKEKWPEVRVIIITTFEEITYAAEALRLGAEGYLLKTLHPKELAATIRLIYGGGTMISQEVAQQLFQDQQLEAPLNQYDLTERELEVLQELTEGLRNKQIAQKLHLSEGTVRNYISAIYLKLQVGDRDEAVEKSRKEQLVQQTRIY
ncbi:hybrid sensor histidine kinase/response regulator transcription factor [Paenibacillus sonchi]|uniref:Hybrid sensor histidine kinase/response regulator transcription factor n=3 Tax=Paenibacillus sonchi TaxID=373687 RepID=A0A974PES2_9BACL|nr:hybrid sensor histidine kinase/response regulator transcription factor [Paenibacillus sonchi]QQZ62525.1 hybrid sensor histidine kinase/response regulator transcription factor [Paenibacillus sonchi]